MEPVLTYMTSIDVAIIERSLLVGDEAALEGITTISAETQASLAKLDIASCIGAEFLKALRTLSMEEQELVLAYYVLAKTQATLAVLHRSTQTLTGARIRAAMQRLGTFIQSGKMDTERPVSKRKMGHAGHAYIANPSILGEFRQRIEDADFASVFTARANRN